MSDINNQKFYVFLSSFGDKDAWLKKADSDGNGRVIASEFMQFVEAEWSNWSGEETPSDDIINRFWRSIDTQTTGKMYDDNLKSVDDLNALNSKEIENINKKMAAYNKIYELINQKGLTCPSGLNVTQWKNAIATELSLVFEGKDEAYVESHFEAELPKAIKTATIKIAKDTFLKQALQSGLPKGDGYDIYEDSDLENVIQNAISNLADDATADNIVNTIKNAINEYIATRNRKDETKDDDARLNNIQRATLIDDINNEIESGINNSDYKDYRNQIQEIISQYKNDVLSDTTNGTLSDALDIDHWQKIQTQYNTELEKILDTGKYNLKIDYPREVNAGEKFNITLGHTYEGNAAERQVTYRINGQDINGTTFTDTKNTAGTYPYKVELLVDGKVVDSKTETVTVNVVANNNNNDVNNNDDGNDGGGTNSTTTEIDSNLYNSASDLGLDQFVKSGWRGHDTGDGNACNKDKAWAAAKDAGIIKLKEICENIYKGFKEKISDFNDSIAKTAINNVYKEYKGQLDSISSVPDKGDSKDLVSLDWSWTRHWRTLRSTDNIVVRIDDCGGIGYEVIYNVDSLVNNFVEEYNKLANGGVNRVDPTEGDTTPTRTTDEETKKMQEVKDQIWKDADFGGYTGINALWNYGGSVEVISYTNGTITLKLKIGNTEETITFQAHEQNENWGMHMNNYIKNNGNI